MTPPLEPGQAVGPRPSADGHRPLSPSRSPSSRPSRQISRPPRLTAHRPTRRQLLRNAAERFSRVRRPSRSVREPSGVRRGSGGRRGRRGVTHRELSGSGAACNPTLSAPRRGICPIEAAPGAAAGETDDTARQQRGRNSGGPPLHSSHVGLMSRDGAACSAELHCTGPPGLAAVYRLAARGGEHPAHHGTLSPVAQGHLGCMKPCWAERETASWSNADRR